MHNAGSAEAFSEPRRVTLAFRLGEILLREVHLTLRVHRGHFSLLPPQEPDIANLAALCAGNVEGVMIGSQPLTAPVSRVRFGSGWIRYAPRQYRRCTIDLSGTFAEYTRGFSSKTRSTLSRKVRRFVGAAGAAGGLRTYRTPEEMPEFFELATRLSARTYQERLLDAGLPTDEAYRGSMVERAGVDQVRAYLLFAGNRPVAYLICPAWRDSGILLYQYLGYDPEYRHLSPGTVLQYLALEQLFEEGKYSVFDFLEGETEQKQLFATRTTLCADIYYLRQSPRAIAIVALHTALEESISALGRLLKALKVKGRIRNLIRRRFPGRASNPPEKT